MSSVTYNPETVPELLGPDGPLAGQLGQYEDRPYQRELALEVARLLEVGGRLAIEAPTGIGKSLGYGLPAAAFAVAGHGPVVVSTHTKALQEQLLKVEAPRLEHVVGQELITQILKGRSNYLCRRRYEMAIVEATGEGTVDLLSRLRPWVEDTRTGDFAESLIRDSRDRQYMAARLSSDPQFCAHSACTPASGCFFKVARAGAAAADLLVVNHALLAIHLFGGYEILPRTEALIIDEAHGFVRVALDHLTASVGSTHIMTLLEAAPGESGTLPRIVGDSEGAGRLAQIHRSVATVEERSRVFFGTENGPRTGDDPRQRYRSAGEYAALCPLPLDPLDDALGALLADTLSLESFVSERLEDTDDFGAAFLGDIRRFREETIQNRSLLLEVSRPEENERERVLWKEWGAGGFSLNAAPLELGPHLSPVLREGPNAIVFTSATLASGKDFTFFSKEVGMDGDLHSVAYPSPFSFEDQALVAAVRSGPDPRDPGWVDATASTLAALMHEPARKTLALFTSYRDLSRVHAVLARNKPPFELLAQTAGTGAAQLLDAFRAADRALLLGTASFWEGVDLPGGDLEVLVLTRLPFGVPTDPRFQARSERLETEGGNPFTELYLPEAVLRFKQGFGRLIRRRSDRGIVAVLDPRLLGKGYGKKFSAALPLPVTEVRDGADLARTAAAWWSSSREGDMEEEGKGDQE